MKKINIFTSLVILLSLSDIAISKVLEKQPNPSSSSSSTSTSISAPNIPIPKEEKNEKNEDLLQTCKLTHKCRTCSFDEVLTTKECEETGQTEIYQCPSVKEPVYNSCKNGNSWSSIYIICGGLWLLLIAGMKLFYIYKEQLELQLNFDRK